MTLALRASATAAQTYRLCGAWRDESVLDDLARWVSRTPDMPALLAYRSGAGLIRLTYRDLARYVEQFAAALAELGVGPGDVVSVQLPNWWQAAALGLACWRRGVILASIMPTIRDRELELMLVRLRTRVFVTVDEWDGYGHAAAVAAMAPRLPALRHRIVLGEQVKDDEIDFAEFFENANRLDVPPRADDPDAVAVALFTSGTTGAPKAVLRTLNSFYAQMEPLLPADTSPPRVHTPQSMMHAAGLSVLTVTLLRGGSLLLTDRWGPAQTAQLLAEQRIEHLYLVPPFLKELLAALRNEMTTLPALREVFCTAATIPAQLVADAADVLALPLGAV